MKVLSIGNISQNPQCRSVTFGHQPKRPVVELLRVADFLIEDGKKISGEIETSLTDFADVFTPTERLAALEAHLAKTN